MTKKIAISIFSLLLFSRLFSQTSLFDDGWRFHRGGAQSAERTTFDDSQWRTVDLPHDWSIEDLPGTQSPFDPDAIGQVSTGFTVGGTGWYRKPFTVPAEQKDKRIIVQFDGVYMNSEFWLNGESLGKHPYGYTSFWFDMTDKIKFGEKNILVVQVKNEGQNSRWYSGSGIYRHVWLKVLDPVHVAQWGTYITTPVATATSAKVNIKTSITNESANAANVTLVTHILNNAGVEITKTTSTQNMEANKTVDVNQDAAVTSPQLWSLESPVLYTAVSEVIVNGKTSDKKETKYGSKQNG